MSSSLPSISYGVKAGMAHSVYRWTGNAGNRCAGKTEFPW